MLEERLAGYGILGQPFARGDVLALWRCSASSIGAPCTAVWHRDGRGRWTLFADVQPEHAVPPFIRLTGTRVAADVIGVSWTGARHLVVTVRDAGLVWSIELSTTVRTRVASALVGRLSVWQRRDRRAARLLAPVVGRALGLGHVRLPDRAPDGRCLRVSPRTFSRVRTTRAAVRGHDFGPPAACEAPPAGDLPIPARGVFAAGEMFLEAACPER